MLDWATLAVASLLMIAGLVATALARSGPERVASLAVVIGASTVFAAPAASLRIVGLTIVLAALGAGQLVR